MHLDGVRILDFSRLLPGPYATQLLSDLGCEVIKIEDTGPGDYAREMEPRSERGVGTIFEAVNRGKRSVAIDLKTDEGRDVLYELVEDSDAVLEQFRPGVVDRLEIDYETLREHNEELVYCSLSGYGQTGPYADRAGHDVNYVGLAGLLDLTRENETARPQVPGYQIGDLGGGLFAAFAIVAGLLSRELGGTGVANVAEPDRGGYVDVSMTDVVASFSQAVSIQALAGEEPRPGRTPLAGGYPWYDVYETADGEYVTLGALEPKFWRAFCETVDREDLVDAHGSDDPAVREALRSELESLFVGRTREAWTEILGPDTMTAPVLSLAEALEHPQIADRIVRRPEDAPPRVGLPACGSGVPEPDDESLPRQGEDTAAVLRELGYEKATIDRLAAAGAIEVG